MTVQQQDDPLYCPESNDHQHEIDPSKLEVWTNEKENDYTVMTRCIHCYSQVHAQRTVRKQQSQSVASWIAQHRIKLASINKAGA